MGRACRGIVVAGLRGGSGKTLITMGLVGSWRKVGRNVAAFKKGPDYIDAAWLGLAAGRPCRNLDPYLMSPEQLLASYVRHTEAVDGAVVEGNRGLYDGVDEHGTYSTGELARLLGLPVLVVVDGTKTTRTAAAMVLGLRAMDPELNFAGVILNQVAGSRHETILRRSIETYSGLEVLGAVPRIRDLGFPERHLGLVPPAETDISEGLLHRIQEAIESHVDLNVVWERAKAAKEIPNLHLYRRPKRVSGRKVRLGVIKDKAFHFYYPDNLDALADEGVEIVYIDALSDKSLVPVEGLYIGGGFPEVMAQGLSDNAALRGEIREAAKGGLPIYAECGGLMYLGRGIRAKGKVFPMVGVLPLWTEFTDRPQGHGYVVLECIKENPFVPVGEVLKGHEFHYSRIVDLEESSVDLAFAVRRGSGAAGLRDGIVFGNVLAMYGHIHSGGCEGWARWLAAALRREGVSVDGRIRVAAP